MAELLFLLFTIPIVTGLIGWTTNWAAVKMIFYPQHFVGLGPLGWQAILARHADKFAGGVAEMVTQNLVTAGELADRIPQAELTRLLEKHLDAGAEPAARRVADALEPGQWETLAPAMQAMVVAMIRDKGREALRQLGPQVKTLAIQSIDLGQVIFSSLTGRNIGVMIRLTKYIARSEFRFIEYYGGLFGLLIGLVQVALWGLLQRWWLIPAVGAVVGLVTNWLAIQMIFKPRQPKRYLGFVTYQGLFPKRQAAIAADYGKIAATEILTPRRMLQWCRDSGAGDTLERKLKQLAEQHFNRELQEAQTALPGVFDLEKIEAAKQHAFEALREILLNALPEIEELLDQHLQVGRTIEERMAALPKDRFERILRGIFEEEERTLILVGGFLGLCVGLLQALVVLRLGSGG